MTYFTIMLRAQSYQREWYVVELEFGNPLHKIHKQFKQVFNTRGECEDAIHAKILVEGGRFLSELPRMGREKGFKSKIKNKKKRRRYYSSPSREM